MAAVIETLSEGYSLGTGSYRKSSAQGGHGHGGMVHLPRIPAASLPTPPPTASNSRSSQADGLVDAA